MKITAKTIVLGVITVVMLGITLLLEQSLNSYEVADIRKIFDGNDGILVSYSEPIQFTQIDPKSSVLPLYFKAVKDAQFTVFDDSYFSVKKDTVLRTLIFRKNRLHLELVDGTVYLDNSLSAFPITLQVGNALLSPYKKGIYSIVKENEAVSMSALSGNAIVGVYNRGTLQMKLLLPFKKSISFNGFLDSTNIALSDISQTKYTSVNIDEIIKEKNIFNLKYKGQNINLTSSNFGASSVRALTLNAKKQSFLSVYPFAQKSQEAENALLDGQTAVAQTMVTEASTIFDDQTVSYPTSLAEYKSYINNKIAILSGLRPSDKLYLLKTFFNDKFLGVSDVDNGFAVTLSTLADIQIEIDAGREEEATKLILNLKKPIEIWLKNKPNPEDLVYAVQIIDDTLTRYAAINIVDFYGIRSLLASGIKTSDFGTDFQLQNIAHMKRLQDYFDKKTIPMSDIKQSAIFLNSELSSLNQVQFQGFVVGVTQ